MLELEIRIRKQIKDIESTGCRIRPPKPLEFKDLIIVQNHEVIRLELISKLKALYYVLGEIPYHWSELPPLEKPQPKAPIEPPSDFEQHYD